MLLIGKSQLQQLGGVGAVGDRVTRVALLQVGAASSAAVAAAEFGSYKLMRVCVQLKVLRTLTCARRYFEARNEGQFNSKDALAETLYLIARTYGAIPAPCEGVLALRDRTAAAFLALRAGG